MCIHLQYGFLERKKRDGRRQGKARQGKARQGKAGKGRGDVCVCL